MPEGHWVREAVHSPLRFQVVLDLEYLRGVVASHTESAAWHGNHTPFRLGPQISSQWKCPRDSIASILVITRGLIFAAGSLAFYIYLILILRVEKEAQRTVSLQCPEHVTGLYILAGNACWLHQEAASGPGVAHAGPPQPGGLTLLCFHLQRPSKALLSQTLHLL